jgi:hypothetical protein
MAIIKKSKDKMLARMWRKGEHIHCWWRYKISTTIMKKFLQKLGLCMIQQPQHWAYESKGKSVRQRGICATVFIVALFTVAKIWNQPRYPSMEEWIRKAYIYMMEYHSAIKTMKSCNLQQHVQETGGHCVK